MFTKPTRWQFDMQLVCGEEMPRQLALVHKTKVNLFVPVHSLKKVNFCSVPKYLGQNYVTIQLSSQLFPKKSVLDEKTLLNY